MKNSFFLIALVLLFVSCDKELNGEIEMKLNEKRSNSDITLAVTGISDNRCPTGANCIVAGWYEVTFDVTKDNSVVTFVLGNGDDNISDTTVFDYQIHLTDVTPYPSGNDNINDKVVHLKVNKK